MAEKIATEKDAYDKGKKGSPVNNKGCTKARAIALGCNPTPLTSFSDKQLVRTNSLAALYDGPSSIYGIHRIVFKLYQTTLDNYIGGYTKFFRSSSDSYINDINKTFHLSIVGHDTVDTDVYHITAPANFMEDDGTYKLFGSSYDKWYAPAATNTDLGVYQLDDDPDNIPYGDFSFYTSYNFSSNIPNLPADDYRWSINQGFDTQWPLLLESVNYTETSPDVWAIGGSGYMAVAEIDFSSLGNHRTVCLSYIDVQGTCRKTSSASYSYSVTYYIGYLNQSGILSYTGTDLNKSNLDFDIQVALIPKTAWSGKDLTQITF